MSSNVNGSLSLLDTKGKLTLINIFEKCVVFETTSVVSLLENLKL